MPVHCITSICGCAILAVVVLGIAAAVGIPAVVNYVRRSKAQEVHQNMDALTHLVVDHCQTQGGYAGLAAGPIPAAGARGDDPNERCPTARVEARVLTYLLTEMGCH